MKKLTILCIQACAVLFLITASVNAGQPQGIQGNVTIVNPLPVPVTGDVNATVSGDVNVVNDSNNPVPVKVVKAIEQMCSSKAEFLYVGCPAEREVYTVPDGKFLIIGDASGKMSAASNPEAILPDGGVSLSLFTYKSGDVVGMWGVTVVAGNELPVDGGRPVRLYAGPGDKVMLSIEGCSEDVNASVSFVGKLIHFK